VQAIRVWDSANDTSHLLQEDPRSLIGTLSERALYGVRVYALLSPEQESKRAEIAAAIDADLLTFLK